MKYLCKIQVPIENYYIKYNNLEYLTITTFLMDNLHSKIQEAANLFRNHYFKKSLQIYEQCIAICKKNQQPKALLSNLLSTKGALMSILGDQGGALQILNQVLKDDPYHVLCLMRRSQVYKKKNQLNKALKDLQLLGNFSPDNLQIAAMRLQIESMKLKRKQQHQSPSSQSVSSKSDNELDEEQQLKFFNLKMIDRKSVSIKLKPQTRKSRVTIAGDIAIEYDAVEDVARDDKSFASTNVSKQYAKEKFIKTFKEISLDQDSTFQTSLKLIEAPLLKIKSTPPRTKSILKNKDSMLYVNIGKPIEKEKKYGGRESKIIDLLINIDGKVIKRTGPEKSNTSIKEVEFRKSVFGGIKQLKALSSNQSLNTKPKTARKSCLKRSSFQVPNQVVKTGKLEPRRSKFDSISKVGIDGIVIRRRKSSIELEKDEVSNTDGSLSDSFSDEGSSHNIFGKKKIVISKQVRDTFGLGDDILESTKEGVSKLRGGGGKSILKKQSMLLKTVQKSKDSSSVNQVKKPKKSVMFSNSS